MDEVIIEKQEYLLFDKYKLNTNRNITRYEYISNVPLKVSKREPDMRVCKCGAHLITLALKSSRSLELTITMHRQLILV